MCDDVKPMQAHLNNVYENHCKKLYMQLEEILPLLNAMHIYTKYIAQNMFFKLVSLTIYANASIAR